MIKLYLFLLAALLAAPAYAGLAVSAGTGVHTHSDANTGGGTLTLSGTLSSTKACATGFTRSGPNYCKRTATASDTWADATACTARTFTPALPADATAVALFVRFQALANNAIASRENDVNFYTDATCTVGAYVGTVSYGVREFAAVAAATTLGISSIYAVVPLAATNTIRTTQTNAGGNGNAEVQSIQVVGYFD